MKTYLDVELYYYYYYNYIMRLYTTNWKFGGRKWRGADAARVIFLLLRRELQDIFLSTCLLLLYDYLTAHIVACIRRLALNTKRSYKFNDFFTALKKRLART